LRPPLRGSGHPQTLAARQTLSSANSAISDPEWRALRRHMPSCVLLLLVVGALDFAGVTIAEARLSFIANQHRSLLQSGSRHT
jgi:ABC-type dipeptide/oligopeptide/nickel transport system permease subunit